MQILKKILSVLILLIISIGVIFYQFPNIPKNLSYDEVEFARLALSLEKQPPTPYSPMATGHSTLYFYIILLSFKVFGVTDFALRFPSALFGVLSVLVFYFLMRKVFEKLNTDPPAGGRILNTLLPFSLSIIFITSHWYFNFARFSFEATFLIFLELTSLLFIISWLNHSKSVWRLIFSGIFAGLAYNSYTPGRIFFLIPLVTILLSLRTKRSEVKQSQKIASSQAPRNDIIRTFLTFIIPFLIVILPLTFYILTHKDDRVDKQFFPKNTEMSIVEKADFFTKNIASLTLMFDYKGDINGRHNYPGKPALNPILGIFFFAGLIFTITNYKKFENQLFLLYFLIALIPATLTYPWENPNMLRTFTVIPSVIYFIGIFFICMLNKFKNKKVIVIAAIVFLIVASSIYELRTYFIYQTQVFKDAFEIPMKLTDALKIIKK